MKNKFTCYAYETTAYDINIYKVIEKNGELKFKLVDWRTFSSQKRKNEIVKELEEQGYKSKISYIKENTKKLILKKDNNN